MVSKSYPIRLTGCKHNGLIWNKQIIDVFFLKKKRKSSNTWISCISTFNRENWAFIL